jgi:hypothetical protein
MLTFHFPPPDGGPACEATFVANQEKGRAANPRWSDWADRRAKSKLYVREFDAIPDALAVDESLAFPTLDFFVSALKRVSHRRSLLLTPTAPAHRQCGLSSNPRRELLTGTALGATL